MPSRFNPPPGWPTPPEGWQPPQDWRPDPNWPPAPEGWQFFLDDDFPGHPLRKDFEDPSRVVKRPY